MTNRSHQQLLMTSVTRSYLDTAVSSGWLSIGGLVRLISTYTGNLLKVRRSSDNTTLDIGQNGLKALDSAALLSFCGAGDGFVDTLYDQSGNSKHRITATQSHQPKIVSSGSYLGYMEFDGTDDSAKTLAPGMSANKFTLLWTLRHTAGTGAAVSYGMFETSTNSNNNTNALAFYNDPTGAFANAPGMAYVRSSGLTAAIRSFNDNATDGMANAFGVLRALWDMTGTDHSTIEKPYWNGAIQTEQGANGDGSSSPASGTVGNYDIYWWSRAETSIFHPGKDKGYALYDGDLGSNAAACEAVMAAI